MSNVRIRKGLGMDAWRSITFIVIGSTLCWHAAGVLPCSEESLRQQLAAGGTVTLDCDGVIPISSTLRVMGAITLDGIGHEVVISGGNLVRLFTVEAGARLTLRNLTLADGRSSRGAAILNNGGIVRLENVTFINHSALGNSTAAAGEGGAVYNSGLLTAARCAFYGNAARGTGGVAGRTDGDGTPGGTGGGGFGGALVNVGEADLSECRFENNSAQGGTGGRGGDGASSNNVRDSSKAGGPGGLGAEGGGGAIVHRSGSLNLLACTFANNLALGGAGGDGGQARSAPIGAGAPGGAGGAGGSADGGAVAILAGRITFTNCTFVTNMVQGGPGGLGAFGSDCRSGRGDGGAGGAGGAGGIAQGGALARQAGEAQIAFSTFAFNGARGGRNGLGRLGGDGCSVAFDGPPGADGLAGVGVGGALASTEQLPLLRVSGSILAHNIEGLNCFGGVRDDRNNLSSDASCEFGPPSPIDPLLGAFSLQGGTVPTVALQPTSPAVNAISVAGQRDVSCPAQDARGVGRGSKCDIGAFEFTPVALGAAAGSAVLRIEFSAAPASACRLEGSTDLQSWAQVAEASCDLSGRVVFVVALPDNNRFFRLSTD